MKRTFGIAIGLVAAVAALSLCSTAMAQPPGGPPPGGFGGPPGGPGGFGGGGILQLAMRDEVQQELQLVDEQKDKVRNLVDGARDRMRDQFRDVFANMREMSEEERQAKFGEIRAKMEEINADMEKDLGQVLLPHQMERLNQIDLQSKMRYRGAGALTGGDVAKALNLTDEQREKLEKRAAEVQEELQTKIRELQADARKKMIDVLSPEQQAQLQKLMGDNFDMPDQGPGNFRGRFGRGGGGPDGGDRGRGERRRGGEREREGKDAA